LLSIKYLDRHTQNQNLSNMTVTTKVPFNQGDIDMILILFGFKEMTNSLDKEIHMINMVNQNLNNRVHSSTDDYGNVS